MSCEHSGHDHDTDCDPTCCSCGEVTPCPEQHTCGRTPQGTLPAHQPHKAEVQPMRWPIAKAFEDFARAFSKAYFTLAGPSEDS